MAKVTLQDLTSLSNEQSAITAINNNNTAIEVAMEKTLSRNGTSPNSMEANLDMNSNRILNLPYPASSGEPLTKEYLDQLVTDTGFVIPPDVFVKSIDTSDSIVEGTSHLFNTPSEKIYLETITKYGGGTAGISAMASARGYVTFPYGNTDISTDTTIDVPVYFQEGAYITVASTKTLTLSSRIESSRQHIFRGEGSYSLLADGDSGEDSKQVHISWFGGFPSHNEGTDVSNNIRTANAALGNLREGVINFDNGAYFLSSDTTIEINRGICIQGQGSRRTIFRVTTDDVDVFTTAGVAVKFKDIQFELSGFTNRDDNVFYIKGNHADLEVYNISFQNGQGVDIQAANARIEYVISNFASALGSGTSLIRMGQATGHRVVSVQANTSAFGPEALVRIGGSDTVSMFILKDVQSVLPITIPVIVDGSAGSVVRGNIDGIIYSGSSGTAPDYCLSINNSSTFTISDINLSNIVCTPYGSNGILLTNTGSGTLEDIQISNTTISGSSGKGIDIVQSAGVLKDIFIGDTVNISERATPVSYTGTVSNIRISPAVTPNANAAYCYQFSVADDGVAQINLNKSVFTGVALLTAGNTNYGMFLIRAATTPAITNMITSSSNVETSTSALTGTTGTDAKITIGVQPGVIYLENRLGSTQNIHLTLMAGV